MKRRIIISIILLVLIISSFFIKNKYNIKYNNNVYLAVLVNGTESSSIPAKGNYNVDITCNNATGKWDYDNWKAIIKNINGKVTCSISFNSTTPVALNSYIIGLAGSTQGTAQIVNETIDTSTFTPTTTFTSTNYTHTTNDATYPFTWDDTNKNWTSTNKVNSTTSTITFKPSAGGDIGVCYTISSEEDYDEATFYVDDVSKGVVSGSSTSCLNLGSLTTSNVIKVTYAKDSSDSSGNDNVIFYLTYGTSSSQTINTGYRYEGKDPNNYISFNGELWRIIGVFDDATHGVTGTNLVKIMRAEPIGSYVWNKSNTNDWPNSSLYHLLNDYYYNGTNESTVTYCYGYSGVPANCDFTYNGITNSTYRSMIQNVTWHLGGMASATTASTVYTAERGTTVYTGRSTTSTGNIGLMYMSDYGYSVLASSCARTTNMSSYNSSTCSGQSWIYGKGTIWTIVPYSSSSFIVWSVDYAGYAGNNYADHGYAVGPVLY